MHHRYLIVGGGIAGASAVEGIRAHDPEGSVLLMSRENHPPYQRPPLSKDLWYGRVGRDELAVHPDGWYREHGVEVELRREAIELDLERRLVWDERGVEHEYERLLLATGGRPRRLDVRGAEIEGVRYYRDLDDYLFLEAMRDRLEHVLVVGSGLVGLELSLALAHNGVEVTLLTGRDHPLADVLPRDLGGAVAEHCRQHGVETVSGEWITRFEERPGLVLVSTASGATVTTQLVLVDVGLEPHLDLAEASGLEVGEGIVVDEFARTSDPHAWAAGDVAEFPCLSLQRTMRIEQWEHARAHGRCAGANMAGAGQPYTGLPWFASDVGGLWLEGVGEIDAALDTQVVWAEPMVRGVTYYLRGDVVRGVLAWNLPGQRERAAALVRSGLATTPDERKEAIPLDEAIAGA